jgi:hypothetical protein
MPGNWQLFQLVSAPPHNGVADAVAKLTVLADLGSILWYETC